MTPLYFGEKKDREKRKEKKKIYQSSITALLCALTTPPKKSLWVAYDVTVKRDGMISHALFEGRKSLLLVGASIPHTNYFYFENNNYIY
jgi:hypothetical protein